MKRSIFSNTQNNNVDRRLFGTEAALSRFAAAARWWCPDVELSIVASRDQF